jgi:hypothetical protein
VCVVPENDGYLVISKFFSRTDLVVEGRAHATYGHLPIDKKTFDLFLYFEKIVRKFSRYDKYTFEADLRDTSRPVLNLVCAPTTACIRDLGGQSI